MPELAVIGAAPAQAIPTSNVAEWIFSHPFSKSSSVIKDAPTLQTKSHHIPFITGEKPILVNPETNAQVSWERARQDSLRIAQGLHKLGLKPSSIGQQVSPVVLVHLPNCIQYGPILYGIFAAGIVASTVNPLFTPTELEHVISLALPQMIITTPEGFVSVQSAISSLNRSGANQSPFAPDGIFIVDPTHDDYGLANPKGNSLIPQGSQDWKQLLDPSPLERPVELSGQDCQSHVALILWSSGTTGKSKGVKLSHYALTSGLVVIWHSMYNYGSDERWIGSPPFYHVFGIMYSALLAPCCGATVFTMSKFDPKQMVDLVQKYRITYLQVGPPVIHVFAKSPLFENADFSSVKGILSGGAPVGPEILEMAWKRLHVFIYMGFGSSEAGCLTFQLGKTWNEYQQNIASQGEPMYGVEIKIVSMTEPGKILERGQEGEILVRTPSLFMGYLNNTNATAETFDPDGYIHSGDIGHIDLKGRICVTDRLKEVIKVKGFQVAPSELEAALCASSFIVDAGVTSVYDDDEGSEFPRAYVVPTDEEALALCKPNSVGNVPNLLAHLAEQIKSWMESRTIAYKWLRGNIVFVKEIPKSPAGKILRRLLKDTPGLEVVLYPKKQRENSTKL